MWFKVHEPSDQCKMTFVNFCLLVRGPLVACCQRWRTRLHQKHESFHSATTTSGSNNKKQVEVHCTKNCTWKFYFVYSIYIFTYLFKERIYSSHLSARIFARIVLCRFCRPLNGFLVLWQILFVISLKPFTICIPHAMQVSDLRAC